MGKTQATIQQQGGKGNIKRNPSKMENGKASAGPKNRSLTYTKC